MSKILWIVRLKRMSRGLSLADIGKIIGTSAYTVSKIERNPAEAKVKDLKRVCEVLDLELSEIIKLI